MPPKGHVPCQKRCFHNEHMKSGEPDREFQDQVVQVPARRRCYADAAMAEPERSNRPRATAQRAPPGLRLNEEGNARPLSASPRALGYGNNNFGFAFQRGADDQSRVPRSSVSRVRAVLAVRLRVTVERPCHACGGTLQCELTLWGWQRQTPSFAHLRAARSSMHSACWTCSRISKYVLRQHETTA